MRRGRPQFRLRFSTRSAKTSANATRNSEVSLPRRSRPPTSRARARWSYGRLLRKARILFLSAPSPQLLGLVEAVIACCRQANFDFLNFLNAAAIAVNLSGSGASAGIVSHPLNHRRVGPEATKLADRHSCQFDRLVVIVSDQFRLACVARKLIFRYR